MGGTFDPSLTHASMNTLEMSTAYIIKHYINVSFTLLYQQASHENHHNSERTTVGRLRKV